MTCQVINTVTDVTIPDIRIRNTENRDVKELESEEKCRNGKKLNLDNM